MKNETGWSFEIFCVSLDVLEGKWGGVENGLFRFMIAICE
jgi:hypothetical protein